MPDFKRMSAMGYIKKEEESELKGMFILKSKLAVFKTQVRMES